MSERAAKNEAALLAIYALRRAADEATHGLTANGQFIDQEVLVALGHLERAFIFRPGFHSTRNEP